jgi:hypothetical protein
MILGKSLKHELLIGETIMSKSQHTNVSGILYSLIRSSIMGFIGRRTQIDIDEIR